MDAVPGQAVAVGGHGREADLVGGLRDLEVYPAEVVFLLVVAHGIVGVPDDSDKGGGVEVEGLPGHVGHGREFVGTEAGHGEERRAGGDVDPVVFDELEGDVLCGQFVDYGEQLGGVQGCPAGGLDVEACGDGVQADLQVGGEEVEASGPCVQEDVVEDGHGYPAAGDAMDALQGLLENFYGDGEFHGYPLSWYWGLRV